MWCVAQTIDSVWHHHGMLKAAGHRYGHCRATTRNGKTSSSKGMHRSRLRCGLANRACTDHQASMHWRAIKPGTRAASNVNLKMAASNVNLIMAYKGILLKVCRCSRFNSCKHTSIHKAPSAA